MAIQRFNAVGGYSTGITGTAVIDSLGNITGVSGSFTGTLTGITGNFSGLLSASKGISASGGSTFAANVQAATYTETLNQIRVTNNARSWFL